MQADLRLQHNTCHSSVAAEGRLGRAGRREAAALGIML